MKIYCICLPNRKEHCNRFFEKLDVKPVYVTPCLSKNIKMRESTRPVPVTLGDSLNVKITEEVETSNYPFVSQQYNAYPSKLACTISHRNALHMFLHSNEDTCIVFEDDNSIPSSHEINRFNYWKAWLSQNHQHFNLVNLSPCFSRRVATHATLHPNLFASSGFCMNCYSVSRDGARQLLEKVMTNKMHTLDHHLPFVTKSYEIHPRVFSQNLEPSLLENPSSPPEFFGQ